MSLKILGSTGILCRICKEMNVATPNVDDMWTKQLCIDCNIDVYIGKTQKKDL